MTVLAARYDKRQPSKETYSAIVYISGSQVVAEDADGRMIASGVAGTDDAAVLNAVSAAQCQNIFIASSLNITAPVLFDFDNVRLIGTSAPHFDPLSPMITIDTPIGIQFGAGGYRVGLEIANLHFFSNTPQKNNAIKLYKYHRANIHDVYFTRFSKDLDLHGTWGSTINNIHSYMSVNTIYSTAVAGPLYTAGPNISGVYIDDSRGYGIYLENGTIDGGATIENMHIESANAAGNGININNNQLVCIHGGMLSVPTANYAIYDNGYATLLNGVHIQSGIVQAYSKSRLLGCSFSGTAKVQTEGYNSIITASTFSDITNDVVIYCNSPYSIIAQNFFTACNCKYYVQVGQILIHVTDNTFSACNLSNAYAGTAYDIYINNGQTQNQITGNSSNSVNVAGSIRFVAGNIIRNNIGYLSVTESSGTSTGTGAEQTIAHGLVAAPSTVSIVPQESGATVGPVWADTNNIYAMVTYGKAYEWCANV